MHGLAVEHVFVERGVSGSKPFSDRPEGAKLLEALKPGGVLFTPSSTACSVPLDALDVLAKMKATGPGDGRRL